MQFDKMLSDDFVCDNDVINDGMSDSDRLYGILNEGTTKG